MNAKKLFVNSVDGYQDAGVFYCSTCKCVAKTEAIAESCCKCDMCGVKPPINRRRYCDECNVIWQKQMDDKERQKTIDAFEKATIVTEFDCVWFSENMYSGIDDLIDACIDDDIALPEFVFAMSAVKFGGVSYQKIMEDIDGDCECEDVYPSEHLSGKAELKLAITDFNKDNAEHTIYFIEDRTKKVRVNL